MERTVKLLLIENVNKKFQFKILMFKSTIKFFRINSKVVLRWLMGWQEGARCCPRLNRRSRSCRSHLPHSRQAQRSDGGYSDTSTPFSNHTHPPSTRSRTGSKLFCDSEVAAIAVNGNGILTN